MTSLEPQALVGSWQLDRWEIVRDDGLVTEPFGPGASGLLVYSADGWMTACIMAASRAPLSSPNPRDAPEAERARAYGSYFSYGGRWRLQGRKVVHDVTVALNPAFVGTVQVRDVRLRGRSLALSATEAAADGLRTHRLLWQRIETQ